MGLFLENPRSLDKTMGIVCLILNIIPLPGLGTLIYNIQTKDDKWVNAIVPMVLAITGILFILGLIWGVIDGIRIMQASEDKAAVAAPPAQ